MHALYYEGILQLRNVTDEVLDFVEESIDNDGKVFIPKVIKSRNGVDLHVSSRKFLVKLGRKLQEKFGGEVKVSKKLFTRNRQTSREVHRVNLLFRMCKYKLGDIFEFKGDELKVIKMSEKIHCKNVKTGKKIFLKYESLL